HDPAPTAIYTLSLHDALPIFSLGRAQRRLKQWGGSRRWLEEAANSFEAMGSGGWAALARGELDRLPARRPGRRGELTPTENRVRSEEHTSELQSLAYLVCRLL